ncbi:MAG: hypothetical protein RDU20_08100 [Desulfomonilaceae bacterium]|nr:hypothetical protein [Desulfomonilaceae bacterium]
MSRQVRRLLEGRLFWRLGPTFIALLLSFAPALVAFHFSAPEAFCEQTKADCQRCCEKKDLDEYYMEQCKLKCFRNPDHCIEGGEAVTQARPERKPAPKPKPRRSPFNWPSPLNLTPGNEWEAAAQILSMNGITPQHPNAAPALQAVEAILKEFVQTNPQGGSLPTAQVRRIIQRYR